MDSFEFNKVAGAILGTALGVMALGIIGDMIYASPEPAKPGFVIAVAEAPPTNGPAPVAAPVAPIEVRLQTADVKAGETVAKKCQACHTLGKGEPRAVGPNLYGVVGGPAAHMEGFPYSDAMQKRRAAGVNWTYDELDKFLTDPRQYVPGTLMTFAGLPKPEDRANVIAYLRTLSDSPVPLPPAPTAAATPAAPAPGSTAPAPANPAPAAPAPAAPPTAAPAPGATPPPAAPKQ